MKTIAVFGATGGLGSKLIPFLREKYNVIPIGSKMVDITVFSSVQNFFRNNPIDIVLNFAGINNDSFVHKITDKNINTQYDVVNVTINGCLNIVSNCLPYMREQRYGRIILISSILSIKSVPGTAIYSSCKSFVDTFARIVSTENISKGITCNSIRLGYFDGGMCHRIPNEIQETIKNTIGKKRWGSIDELFSIIEFLIENEYVTGTNFNIDGGLK